MNNDIDVLLDRLIREAGNDGADPVLPNDVLESYLNGSLDAAEKAKVDHLLSRSPDLREDLALFAETSASVDQPEPAPLELIQSPKLSIAKWWPVAIPAAAAALIFFAFPKDSALQLDLANTYSSEYFNLNSRSAGQGELQAETAAGRAYRLLIQGNQAPGAHPNAKKQPQEIQLVGFGDARYLAEVPVDASNLEVRIMTFPSYEVLAAPLSAEQTRVTAPQVEKIAVTLVYKLEGKYFATPAETFTAP